MITKHQGRNKCGCVKKKSTKEKGLKLILCSLTNTNQNVLLIANSSEIMHIFLIWPVYVKKKVVSTVVSYLKYCACSWSPLAFSSAENVMLSKAYLLVAVAMDMRHQQGSIIAFL
jgi:hypothetical protein